MIKWIENANIDTTMQFQLRDEDPKVLALWNEFQDVYGIQIHTYNRGFYDRGYPGNVGRLERCRLIWQTRAYHCFEEHVYDYLYFFVSGGKKDNWFETSPMPKFFFLTDDLPMRNPLEWAFPDIWKEWHFEEYMMNFNAVYVEAAVLGFDMRLRSWPLNPQNKFLFFESIMEPLVTPFVIKELNTKSIKEWRDEKVLLRNKSPVLDEFVRKIAQTFVDARLFEVRGRRPSREQLAQLGPWFEKYSFTLEVIALVIDKEFKNMESMQS